jgi:glycosyltransferase involved in cell wall biosynthesis
MSVARVERGAPLVSIVISSFNYARFLSFAIDSALGQTYGNIEVIVVDDGSTDASRAIIARYGARIHAVLKPNGGETSACNAGFAVARGDIVLFLDSDDVLEAPAIDRIVAAMGPGVSAVQVSVTAVDSGGRPIGSVLPVLPRDWTPAHIRRAVMRAGVYPYPPTSGNAYGRWFLDRMMPMPPDRIPRALDGVLNGAAALHGDVVVLREPLVSYRVHGANMAADTAVPAERWNFYVSLDLQRNAFLLEEAQRLGLKLTARTFERAFYFAQYRLASRKLRPDLHPIAGDTLARATIRFLEAVAVAPDSALRRVLLLAWGIAVALAPRPLANRLVSLRFSSRARSQRLDSVLKRLSLVRRIPTAPKAEHRLAPPATEPAPHADRM